MPMIDEIGEIASAVNRVQQQISHVPKGQKAHQYMYVGEVALVNAIRQLVIDEGLILSPFIEIGHEPTVTVTHSAKGAEGIDVIWKQSFILVHAPSGQVWPEPITVMAEGSDYGDKAVWKGLTAAHKYAWLRLLNIATGDDPEADRSGDTVNRSRGKAQQAKRTQAQQTKPVEEAFGSQEGADLTATQWCEVVGKEYVLEKGDFQRWKLYKYAFDAAEKVFGDRAENLKPEEKFACVDDFKAERQIVKGDTLRAKDVQPFIDYATGGWYQLQQIQD
jgi:hypothetical protein